MQLVAYGAQDIYLTGNPQITFFKVVYRRHTNFAVESIEQTINGSVSGGSKVSVTVARNGDLLSRMYVEVSTDSAAAAGADGFDLIEYAEVEVGGQIIDKHYGAWMKIWCDLTHAHDKKTMLNGMVCGNTDCACGAAGNVSVIPLQFWFCRNPGLALPLIALQYHEVKLNIKFCSPAASVKIVGAEVWCDYIFLDTDERRRFAQVSHEYLIEQVQYNNGADISSAVNLRFNHPVKELVWRAMDVSSGCCNKAAGQADICDVVLQLNGHDRFRKRSGEYFSVTQRYEHHTGAASSVDVAATIAATSAAAGDGGAALKDALVHADVKKTNPCVDAGTVYCYSFALKPEEHQPSGTCNFSRIDNAVMQVSQVGTAAKKLDVYAVNYNVLRIMSGMGGLAYSN